MATNEIKILIRTILEDKNFKKGLKGLDKGLDKSAKKQKSFFKTMKAGWLAIGVAVVGVGAIFKKFFNVAKDFEQAIANVAAVSGGATDELEKLARVAGERTVFSAKEAAESLYFLASAGLDVKDMAEVLEPALNLAAAGQMEIAEATDIVVNNLKVFGLNMSEAEKVTDIMAVTVKSANTDMRQLSEALKTAGPIAATAGVEFEDLNVIIAAMADRGIKGSRAGIQLRQAIARLTKPTKEATDALADYDISIDEITELLPTPIKLFKRLHDANISNADALKILGVRQSGVFSLIKDGIPTIEKLQVAMQDYDGTAKAMAKTQITTVAGALKLLNSKWEEMILSIMTGALPALQSFILGAGNIIGKIAKWISGSTDLEDVTKKLITTQSEYDEVIKKLTDSQKKLTVAERQDLEIRKIKLKLDLISLIKQLNDSYEDQIQITDEVVSARIRDQGALDRLRTKTAAAGKVTIGLTDLEKLLVAQLDKNIISLDNFGNSIAKVSDLSQSWIELQQIVGESKAEDIEQNQKLTKTIDLIASAMLVEGASQELLIGLNEQVRNQVIERMEKMVEEEDLAIANNEADIDRKAIALAAEEARLAAEKARDKAMLNIKMANVADFFTFVDATRAHDEMKEQKRYENALLALKSLYQDQKIDLEQYNKDVEKITIIHNERLAGFAEAMLTAQKNRDALALESFGKSYEDMTAKQQVELDNMLIQQEALLSDIETAVSTAAGDYYENWADAFADTAVEGETLKVTLKEFAEGMVKELIKVLLKMALVKAAKAALSGGIGLLFSKGGKVPSYYASGGKVLYAQDGAEAKGSDTVPAMLTPGERVLSVSQTEAFDNLMGNMQIPTANQTTTTNNNQQSFEDNRSFAFNNEQIEGANMEQFLELAEEVNSDILRR